MRKALKYVIIFLFTIGVLFSLCSCRLEESYKEFNIKDITDYQDEDYFSSKRFDFARVGGVVIVPVIKEGIHEYIVWISAHSENASETVIIKKMLLKEKEIVLLNYDLNQEVEFKENGESAYKGTIRARFTDEEVEIKSGKKFELVIEAEVIKNGTSISKSITYEIEVKGYRSFVLPT